MKKRLPLILFGVLIVAMMAIEMTRPRPQDERLRLERDGTNPFDARILFEMLPDWTGDPVRVIDEAPFLALEGEGVPSSYVFLTDDFSSDEAETERLLRFVNNGGTLFVASQEMHSPLADSLGKADSSGTNELWFAYHRTSSGRDDSTLVLSAPGISGRYTFPFEPGSREITNLDSLKTRVLGTYEDGSSSLVRVAWGEGAIILASTPHVFTNAALVDESSEAAEYVGAFLSYLPDGEIWWDAYYKPLRKPVNSSLRVAWDTPGLRWTLVLIVAGVVLYTVFRGRRRQRAIPVVKTPPNAQREFARTVGRLHMTQGTPQKLVDRLEYQLLDRFRTHLHMPNPETLLADFQSAASRAGVPEEEGEALFKQLQKLRAKTNPSSTELIELDQQVERFFRNVTL